MWHPFARPRTRRPRQAPQHIELLESRQLLAVTQLNEVDPTEVETLLARAAAASKSEDAIIAVVDRGGQILGVRVEQGVLDAIDAVVNGGNGNSMIDPGSAEEETLVYAIDGAVAKARTAAYFANGTTESRPTPESPAGGPTAGPLTSRTVRFISQSTVTQREVQSNPNADPVLEATLRGPGFVAPIGIGGHFPPAIAHTPQVDLFGIEHSNRDSIVHPGEDGIKGTADDITLSARFNIDPMFIPVGQDIAAPESYGFVSGRMVDAQSRGIATLPGGIPLYRGVDLVGGIGVFFPGTSDPDGAGPGRIGDATFEQGFVAGAKQSEAKRLNAPKVLEAEWIAFAAAGGSSKAKAKIGAITDSNNVVIPEVPFNYPFGRIDLVGITLELIGPKPGLQGVKEILKVGKKAGFQFTGGSNGKNTLADSTSGANQFIDPGPDLDPTTLGDNVFFAVGKAVPEGWLVTPHDSPTGTISAAEVTQIIEQGIEAADKVRAAIRLKVKGGGDTTPGARTRMVFAVADGDGNVLGLYRMPDATVFSIDVAVAKARNMAYYADAAQLQDIDRVDDNHDGIPDANVPAGAALSNRTFRFLAEPRYPQGVDGTKPGAFSILTDPGFKNELLKTKNPKVAAGAVENAGAPLAYTDFQSVLGFDSFNVGRNFRQTTNIANQNGIVFFPGAAPLYTSTVLIGGFGVSGDGVDQDDVVTFFGAKGFDTPEDVRADKFKVRGARLPFQKFNRNPFA